MDRPRVRAAQLLLAFILVAGLLYVTDTVAGGAPFGGGYTVSVKLSGGGGLHERSEVSYRGVRIGEVTDLRLDAQGVEATLALDPDVPVPRDTEAVVANLSAVGEQYLDLRPRSRIGPYLEEGDTVHVADTRLPLSTHDLLVDLDGLVRRVDLADVRTISRELDLALGGERVSLLRTAREAGRTFTMLERLQPQTVRIVEHGEVPLRTTVEKAGQLRRFSRNLRLLTAGMKQADPAVNDLVDRAVVAVPELTRLLDETEGSVTRLLTAGLVSAEVAAERHPGLVHWLDWVPSQMVAMAESTRDGSGRVILVPSPSLNCRYATEQHSPTDPTRRPAPRDARCGVEHPGVQQRGAQYAPRPVR
jgi:phospholipid/cholesterol/gamma-HCH transport system substrate-binding protein